MYEFKDGMPAYEFGDSENIIDDQWKHFTLNLMLVHILGILVYTERV